jgi:5S rRNA maturation endonuclease (ribonuclease M5)
VIGAVFGQTEGLLGSELNLRELQKTGRIGRIEVNIESKNGKSEGDIIIPSSLDAAETALMAATLETIERVGPCTAKITVKTVEDTRSEKRKYVVDKAKEILQGLVDGGVPDADELSEEIKEAVRVHEISSYQGLPCGPNLTDSDEMIIVEGRADVITLLKNGIRNTIAIEGTSIPPAITELTKEKISTAFMDGDRGGELNLKALMETAELDFVTMAPDGKEVEELSKKEIYKCLREKVPAKQFKFKSGGPSKWDFDRDVKKGDVHIPKPRQRDGGRGFRKVYLTGDQKERFGKMLSDLVGSRAACVFDSKNQLLGKVPVTELFNTLRTIDNPHTIIFDGMIDHRLNSIAMEKGIKFLVGMEKEDIRSKVSIVCKDDLK